MTLVKFLASGNTLIGFELSGHSSANSSDVNGKLVCAAVSSAAYFAANTITDVIGENAEITVNDAELRLKVISLKPETQAVLKGFKQHMEGLAEQYSQNIKIISEV